jgi:hypothetical protein
MGSGFPTPCELYRARPASGEHIPLRDAGRAWDLQWGGLWISNQEPVPTQGLSDRASTSHDEDTPKRQNAPVRPSRVGVVQQLLVLGNEQFTTILR